MPIYEFKCLKCDEFFELILMNKDEEAELKCPKCSSEEFERVISATNFSMGAGSGANTSLSSQTRACSSGSCTTYDIPGHTK
ncbi:MAG: zinc ribbon domain-containing protein [Desulfobacterium sp.]|nr:zinc ribbon domain-containing protein [Desulfobacterium sp.]MBU3947446.1 zinc ribbon domain-containing protein [Pseudomonadota bacterium]MBU4037757.1 zinc ribbon domain-containing protein [Pseudomonadota bacterium]